MNIPRGARRRNVVAFLASLFSQVWPAHLGDREAAYRALVSAGLSPRIVAEGAGVSRRTVRRAIKRGGPIPAPVWTEARAVVRNLERGL